MLSDEHRRSLLYAWAATLVTLGDPDTGGWIRELAEKKSARIDPENANQEARVDERTDSPLPVTTAGENTLTPATVSDPQVSNTPRAKGVYIGAPACFALEEAIRPICDAFGVYRGEHISGCYVVGSALERPNWRDVDVRLLLDDHIFAAVFPNAGDQWEHDARWLVLTVAISERLSRLTGLPIDFQFQPRTHANNRHKGRRNAIGIRFDGPHVTRHLGDSMEFEEFPKMARLTRECIITEKIDGTNAQILIAKETDDLAVNRLMIAHCDGLMMLAGSRTQYITPERDNHGFARWAAEHAAELFTLGEGRHFGEWWGSGIQRGYGLPKGEKRFSLFNVSRWADERDREKYPTDRPACCHVVPELYRGLFGPKHAENYIETLKHDGSMAAPGFMQPEGVVVYHVAAGVCFKKTIDHDEQPKSKLAVAS